MHADHCPLLKSPISTKQLLTELNKNINQNELDTDINLNESDMNARQPLMSKIKALSTENENLKFKTK